MWFTLIWKWLKKYWKWLLFPVGIALFILGRITTRKPPNVIAPELIEADRQRRRLQEEADRKVFEAALERERKLDELRKEHEAVLRELTDEQREKVKELEADPEKLNDFLLDVGRQIRG